MTYYLIIYKIYLALYILRQKLSYIDDLQRLLSYGIQLAEFTTHKYLPNRIDLFAMMTGTFTPAR